MKKLIKKHRTAAAIIAIIIIVGGYYWYTHAQTAATPAKYVIEAAAPGTVVASVSASGQVEATQQIDLKPQVTETVTRVLVQPGDQVKAGQVLVQLDATNEARAERQAALAVQSAQLQLAQMQQLTTSTLLSNQSAVVKASQSLATASSSLTTDYQNGFDTLSSVLVNLQTVITDVGNFVTGSEVNKVQDNPDAYVAAMPVGLQEETSHYAAAVAPAYDAALTAYQKNLGDYHAASRTADRATLDALLSETSATTQLVSASVKTINDLLNFVVNNYPKDAHVAALPAVTATYQATFGNDITTANNNVASVLGAMNAIANDTNAIQTDALALQQASETLAEYQAGPTPLQIQSQQISIQNAQNNLAAAEENLAATAIRAPVGGVIASVPATVGAAVPSPAVSMVGGGKIALVTLNEVDAAKVQVGQKATLTFDALPDLTLAGQVVEVDPVGTVSQGVVNYNVQVSFAEAQGVDQVKPGMSVTANIVTAAHQNVIAVPNASVVTFGGARYVLEPAAPVDPATLAASAQGGVALPQPPKRVPVTVGIANDAMTEITGGVNVGDEIIVQTLNGGAGAGTAAPAAGGARFGGGGAGILFGRGG